MKKIYLLLTFLFLNLFSQNAFSQKKDVLYEKLDLFGDILETINKEYFKQINEGEVIDGAINGMLQSLDPYSSYMSPKTFKSMNTETKGEFGGLGIEVTMEAGLVKVISPIDDTPADRAGIKSGDYIIKLDSKQVKGLTLDEAVDIIVDAIVSGNRGDIFVPSAPSANMVDLARLLSGKENPEMVFIGRRPGEKIHELLVSDEEGSRTERLGENSFRIKPLLPELLTDLNPDLLLNRELSSADFLMSVDELRRFLTIRGVI